MEIFSSDFYNKFRTRCSLSELLYGTFGPLSMAEMSGMPYPSYIRGGIIMVKKLNDFLAGLPMTIVGGVFLLMDLAPHLADYP